ncbi:fibrinogen-like protein A [Rhopilema esculentum]|uniref:fibrinogen-like protein A n=1 Tax=Rhopilema esculentum TaxID=499914 RepID=UPI0031D7CB4D
MIMGHFLKVFCIQTCVVLVKSNFVTFGHFYHVAEGENIDEESKNNEVFIKQEFFTCSREETCSRLLKRDQGAKSFTFHKNKGADWNKIKQPSDCKDLYDSGKKESGAYHITRPNKQVLKVYCDMETDGGGWTVIQRRIDGSTDFNRGWSDYKHGFGDVEKEMWIGLENMHSLASPSSNTTLRIELKHLLKGNQSLFAKYGSFKIADESDGYRISHSDYSGTAGDACNMDPPAVRMNGMRFFTKDFDNDFGCSVGFQGGWWFNRCHSCYLNGLIPYKPSNEPTFMSWKSIDLDWGNIYFSEMKLRRN